MTTNSETYVIAGDTHSNMKHLNWLVSQVAPAAGSTKILQLGDFGYWGERGDGHMKYLNKIAEENGVEVYFIDGNHEHHPELRRHTKTDDEGFVIIRDHIRYIPRGHTWEWHGVKFMGLGGAYSVDKNLRKVGYSWFPEETITDEEVEYACSKGQVDVMLTHDVPMQVDMIPLFGGIEGLRESNRRWGAEASILSDKNRAQIGKVVDTCKPVQVFHGHMHTRHTQHVFTKDGHQVRVDGLGCDGMLADSWMPFTTSWSPIKKVET